MRRRVPLIILLILSLILPALPTKTATADTPGPAKMLITEVKLGGDSFSQGPDNPKDPQEFISIFNPGIVPVNLAGWYIEYAKTTFDKNFCGAADWSSHSVNGSAGKTPLSGMLSPGAVSTPIVRSMTDNTAGSLHLVDASSTSLAVINDVVGWGDSAPCSETIPSTTPSSGKSIKRYLDCDKSFPLDTQNNGHDFAANQPPSPGNLNSPYVTSCETDTPPSEESAKTCEGTIISEILPNPTGSDAGKEFIELHNPTTQAISLSGCSLQTSANSKKYNFANVILQPSEYKAFYNGTTGLTLPNNSETTAWLLSPTTELQAIKYVVPLEDDQSWILSGGIWQSSYQTTPNIKNIVLTLRPCSAGEERNPDTNRCRSVLSLTTGNLAPCRVGQERNPATNRCRSVVGSARQLVPCQPGQERNPATNRCRKIGSSSALVPCKAGQERNPATNRCRKIGSSSDLKPCKENQERNPETNRCKKVSGAKVEGMATVKDVSSGPMVKDPKWWLAGFAAAGATSYGVYEWRREILDFVAKIKNKIPFVN